MEFAKDLATLVAQLRAQVENPWQNVAHSVIVRLFHERIEDIFAALMQLNACVAAEPNQAIALFKIDDIAADNIAALQSRVLRMVIDDFIPETNKINVRGEKYGVFNEGGRALFHRLIGYAGIYSEKAKELILATLQPEDITYLMARKNGIGENGFVALFYKGEISLLPWLRQNLSVDTYIRLIGEADNQGNIPLQYLKERVNYLPSVLDRLTEDDWIILLTKRNHQQMAMLQAIGYYGNDKIVWPHSRLAWSEKGLEGLFAEQNPDNGKTLLHDFAGNWPDGAILGESNFETAVPAEPATWARLLAIPDHEGNTPLHIAAQKGHMRFFANALGRLNGTDRVNISLQRNHQEENIMDLVLRRKDWQEYVHLFFINLELVDLARLFMAPDIQGIPYAAKLLFVSTKQPPEKIAAAFAAMRNSPEPPALPLPRRAAFAADATPLALPAAPEVQKAEDNCQPL